MTTKHFWKSLLMSAVLLVSGAMISCENEDEVSDFTAQISTSISSKSVEAGEEVNFTVTSNTKWTATIEDPNGILELSKTAGGSGETAVKAYISQNAADGNRATVTFTAMGYAFGYEIPVSQKVVFGVGSLTPATGSGTLEDPFTAAGANAKAKELASGETSAESYFIKGVVTSVKEAYTTQYGNGTFYIGETQDASETFYVYRAYYLDNKKYSSESDPNVEVGDEVVIYGKICNYNGTLETAQNGAYLYMLNGVGGGEVPSEDPVEVTPGEYYMFGKLESDSNGTSLAPYIYHAWDGTLNTSGTSNYLTTVSYSSDDEKTFSLNPANSGSAAKVEIAAVSGKEGLYTIKCNGQYLYTTEASKNHTLALGDDASKAEWAFKEYSKGGVVATNNGNTLGTGSATRNFLRSYANETQPAFGLLFCKVSETTLDGEGGGNEEPGEIKHAGTLDDPYTAEDANIKAGELASGATSSELYYIKGVVTSVKEAYTTQYGNGTFYIGETKDATKTFYIYRANYLNNQKYSNTSDPNVNVGDEVVIYGKICNYNGTLETAQNEAYLYSLNGVGGGEQGGGNEGGGSATVTLPYTLDTSLEANKGSNSGYATNGDVTVGEITWNAEGNMTMQPWRIGGKGITNQDRAVSTKTAMDADVKKIEITHGTATSITVNSMKVIVSKNADFSSPVSTLTPTFAANSTVTVEKPADADWNGCYYKFVYNLTVADTSSNRFVQFSKVVFSDGTGSGETGGGETDPSYTHTGSTPEDAFTVAEAIAKCKEIGTTASADWYYVKGKISSIKYPFSADFGTANFNMVDEGSTDTFTAYSVKYLENKSWVEGNQQVAVGDEVIVYGKILNYSGNTPETQTGSCYLYSLNGKTTDEGGNQGGGNQGGGDSATVTLPYTLDTTLEANKGKNSGYATNGDVEVEGITWNAEGNMTMQPWRIGGNNITDQNRAVSTKTALDANVNKIEITHGTATSITVNSMTVIVSKNADFSSPVSTLTPTFAANSTVTVEKPANADWNGCYYKFVYNVSVSGSTNRFIQFSKVVFSGDSGNTGGGNTGGGTETPTGGTATIDLKETGATGTGYLTAAQTFTVDGISYTANNYIPNSGQVRGNKETAAENFYINNNTAYSGKIKTVTMKTGATGSNKFQNNCYCATGSAAITTPASDGKAGTLSADGTTITWELNSSDSYFMISTKEKFTSGSVTAVVITVEYE